MWNHRLCYFCLNLNTVSKIYISSCDRISHVVNEKYKQFVTLSQRNNINNKCDPIKMLHKTCEKNSLIDCELLAYGLNNIVYDALYGK